MKDAKDESVITALTKLINKVEHRGYIPKFNIVDNMTSAMIKTFWTVRISAYNLLNHTATK